MKRNDYFRQTVGEVTGNDPRRVRPGNSLRNPTKNSRTKISWGGSAGRIRTGESKNGKLNEEESFAGIGQGNDVYALWMAQKGGEKARRERKSSKETSRGLRSKRHREGESHTRNFDRGDFYAMRRKHARRR